MLSILHKIQILNLFLSHIKQPLSIFLAFCFANSVSGIFGFYKNIAASSSLDRKMSDADASDSSMVEQLKKLLIEYGTELLKPCDSTEELLRKLDKLEHLLSHTLQEDKKQVEVALQPSKEALIANGLIRHAELDVRVSVASCISEIIRITAPDKPYDEDQMKEFFQLANSAFEGLSSMSGRAYSKAVSILQTISCSQSCVLMLDLELYAIVYQMFHLFLDGINTSHSHDIFSSMENIMTAIIHNNMDYDEFSLALVKILLDRLRNENKNVSPVAFQLAENIFKNCSGDLKTYLPEAVGSLGVPVEDYAEVAVSLLQDATQRENMDSEDTAVDGSCPGEAALEIEAGLCNLMEGNEAENLKHDENCNENRRIASNSSEENLCSAKHMQQEQKPDVPIPKKRTRKPNSLIKAEEGYDPFWMFIDWTSLDNSSHRIKRRKMIDHSTTKRISKDPLLSSKPVGEHSRPISPKSKESSAVALASHSRPIPSKVEAQSGKVSNPQHKRKSITSKEEASKVRATSRSFGEELVGCKIKVWWELDETFYEGKVASFDHLYKIHQVEYDDGVIEILDLTGECWQLLGHDNLPAHEQEIVVAPSASTQALNNCGRKSSHLPKRKKASKVRTARRSFGKELVGRKIKIWWELDKTFYGGKIASFDDLYKIHQVEYDDGVIEILDLTRECWKVLRDDNLSTHQQEIVAARNASTEIFYCRLNNHGRGTCSHPSESKTASKTKRQKKESGEKSERIRVEEEGTKKKGTAAPNAVLKA